MHTGLCRKGSINNIWRKKCLGLKISMYPLERLTKTMKSNIITYDAVGVLPHISYWTSHAVGFLPHISYLNFTWRRGFYRICYTWTSHAVGGFTTWFIPGLYMPLGVILHVSYLNCTCRWGFYPIFHTWTSHAVGGLTTGFIPELHMP